MTQRSRSRTPSRHRWLLLAALWALADGVAAAPVLTISLSVQDRRYLVDTNQNVTIVLPEPASGDGANVVVALVLQPISDPTLIGFDLGPTLYLAHPPVAVFGSIDIALSNRDVAYGTAYCFNGAGIVSAGSGVAGYVSIRNNAPDGAGAAIVAGLAGKVYNQAADVPTQPSVLNYYLLNRGQTQVIPKIKPLAWVFLSTGIADGTVVPTALLNAAAPSATAARGRRRHATPTPTPRLGDYLPVLLDASEQNIIHLDASSNAFQYGAAGESQSSEEQ